MLSFTDFILSFALLLCTAVQGYRINVDSHDGNIRTLDVANSNLTAEEFLHNSHKVTFGRHSSLDKRNCVTVTLNQYQIIGDGNPHQNYKIGQMPNTLISCPGTVTNTESHTTGWSWSSGGVEKWIFAPLGFSVTESDTKSVTTGIECEDSNTMTEICAMHYTAVTAISVTFSTTTITCGSSDTQQLGPGTVWLPNANGIGSTVSMGTNFGDRNIIQCRGQAAREIDFNCGPKGGPEFYTTNEIGPWSEAYLSALDPPDCAVPIEALKFKD